MAKTNSNALYMDVLGMPGPFHTQAASPFVIADRDGMPILMAMPTDSGAVVRRDFALLVCAVLNSLCGFAAQTTLPHASAAE